MEYWTVADCCEILDSMRVPITASDRKSGIYPYYGANGIQDHVAEYIFDDELVLLAEDGGNFGSKKRPIAYRVSGKCWVNNHAHVLKPKEGLNVDYLCYSLMFYDTTGIVNGATRQKLTQADMRKMVIPMRSIADQMGIVQRLKSIEQIICNQQRQLRTLDDLVKARFVEMFGDPVANEKCWKQTNIKSICSKITDGEHGSVPRVEAGHPFLNAKHIRQDGSIDWKTITYISDEIHQKIYKRCNPEPGDILMTTTGTIGNVAIVPDVEPFSMDRGITLMKTNYKEVSSQFIAWLLRYEAMQNIMAANIHASAIGHLFLNKVEQLPVIIPPMKYQSGFAAFVSQVDKSKVVVQKALDEAHLLFDSLMQKYFG